jgi:hypothetical protein
MWGAFATKPPPASKSAGRHTSAYVSIRQAYVSIRQHTAFATKPPPASKRAGGRDSVSTCTFVLVKQVNFRFTAGKV